MRQLPIGVEIWGAFLILVGAGLLVFNKRWAAWATPLTPVQFIPISQAVKLAIGRFMTVVVGLMFVVVGASVFLGIGPAPHQSSTGASHFSWPLFFISTAAWMAALIVGWLFYRRRTRIR